MSISRTQSFAVALSGPAKMLRLRLSCTLGLNEPLSHPKRMRRLHNVINSVAKVKKADVATHN